METKTTEKIAKLKANIERLNQEKINIDIEIKKCKAELVKLNKKAQQEKLSMVIKNLSQKGISLDDLLNVTSADEIADLMEKQESTSNDYSVSADETSVDDSSDELKTIHVIDESIGEVKTIPVVKQENWNDNHEYYANTQVGPSYED